jgi:hypothetical protein
LRELPIGVARNNRSDETISNVQSLRKEQTTSSSGLAIKRRNEVSPLAQLDDDVRPLIGYVNKEHVDAGKSGIGSPHW